jgi:tRNA threonylcarbamoyladenosine biosynthesis protein TsaB
VIVLALDTATPATVAALGGDGRPVVEARDDPPPGGRPGHGANLLRLLEQVLGRAGLTWEDVDRIAVGAGPGGFTGLRIGVATARALAQAHDLPIVSVSSLRALALGAVRAAEGRPVLAAIDARRGEAFAAAWAPSGEELLDPAAYPPDALRSAVRAAPAPPLAVGDGAIRFATELVAEGAVVPPEDSRLHRITGAALCELGTTGNPVPRDLLLPHYVREPDARPPRLP